MEHSEQLDYDNLLVGISSHFAHYFRGLLLGLGDTSQNDTYKETGLVYLFWQENDEGYFIRSLCQNDRWHRRRQSINELLLLVPSRAKATLTTLRVNRIVHHLKLRFDIYIELDISQKPKFHSRPRPYLKIIIQYKRDIFRYPLTLNRNMEVPYSVESVDAADYCWEQSSSKQQPIFINDRILDEV